MSSVSETIHAAALAWPGVQSVPHQFGAVEFTIGDREIGHLHGNTLLDVPFPRAVREELVAAGLAEPHHFLPQIGWVSFRIRRADDCAAAIALLRKSYDLITAQLQRRAAQAAAAKKSA